MPSIEPFYVLTRKGEIVLDLMNGLEGLLTEQRYYVAGKFMQAARAINDNKTTYEVANLIADALFAAGLKNDAAPEDRT